MTITHSTPTRNAMADAVVDRVDLGTTNPTGRLVIGTDAAFTTVLATFTLTNPAFGAAASGTATLSGLPVSATASATGTAAFFKITDRDNATVLSGTVSAPAGGGDLIITKTNVVSGESVQVTSFNYTTIA